MQYFFTYFLLLKFGNAFPNWNQIIKLFQVELDIIISRLVITHFHPLPITMIQGKEHSAKNEKWQLVPKGHPLGVDKVKIDPYKFSIWSSFQFQKILFPSLVMGMGKFNIIYCYKLSNLNIKEKI